MDQVIKQLWVEALRSGDYLRTEGWLNVTDEGFCCLGVLCDLAEKAGVVQASDKYAGRHIGYFSDELGREKYDVPPPEVVKWSGLSDSNPDVIYHGATCTLADLNDNEKLTFDQIATVIEEQL